jgi:hypothetical protein
MKKIILFLLIVLPICALCVPNDDPISGTMIPNPNLRGILTKSYKPYFIKDSNLTQDSTDYITVIGWTEGGETLPDPWVLPNNIKNAEGKPAPCASLLKTNWKILDSIYSEGKISEICKKVDDDFADSAAEIQKILDGSPISYIFFDGFDDKKNEYHVMPRGIYYDNMVLALLGARAVNIAPLDTKIISDKDLGSIIAEDKNEFQIFFSPVFEGNMPTPDYIIDLDRYAVETVREMAQAARDKNNGKEAEVKQALAVVVVDPKKITLNMI